MAVRLLLLLGCPEGEHHRPPGAPLLHRLRRGVLHIPAALRLLGMIPEAGEGVNDSSDQHARRCDPRLAAKPALQALR